jgi:thiamine-phosphate pyrophosphorylase
MRGLYFITASHPELGRDHADLALAAVEGGASVVQYRDKESPREEFLRHGAAVRDVCRNAGVAFVVNDDAKAAMELRADGLHLGQSDLEGLSEWRPTWDAFLGISATTLDEAVRAAEAGADYVGAGPVFATGSKPDAAKPMGLEMLREICSQVDVPVAAIGGIGLSDIDEVVRAGAAAVCVISAVSLAPDPREAARALASSCELAWRTHRLEKRGTSWD